MPVKLSSGSHEAEEEARIEIVPLIDIMFFLLASFMLVSLSMTHVNRVPITVPKAKTAAAEKQVPPVHIAVDRNGVITWDQKIVTLTDITDRLKAMPNVNDSGVFVGGDGDSAYKHVMSVIDAVRSAGVTKVGLEASKEEK